MSGLGGYILLALVAFHAGLAVLATTKSRGLKRTSRLLLAVLTVAVLCGIVVVLSAFDSGTILVLLFFAPLSFVYGLRKARRVKAHDGERGRKLGVTLLRLLPLPTLVFLSLAAAMADMMLKQGEELRLLMILNDLDPGGPLPESLSVGNPVIDTAIASLVFAGNAGLIVFFLSVPYVMGSFVAAVLLVLDGAGVTTLLRASATVDATAEPPPRPPMTRPLTIAIDGPAAAGKGTLAKRLAGHYGLPYLDTGLLYRAIGKLAQDRGVDLDDPEATGAIARELDMAHLDEASLRGREVGELASRVAVHAKVRRALDAFQRAFAARPEGAILDGRDIGTVICPQARVKIFVTASAEVRARRRTDELLAKGRHVDYDTILSEVRERDARDAGRAASPLKPAADAHLLDTSEMGIEAAFVAACDIVDKASS